LLNAVPDTFVELEQLLLHPTRVTMLMCAPRDLSVLRVQLNQWHVPQEHTVIRLEFKYHVKIVRLGCIVLLVVSLSLLIYVMKDSTAHHLLQAILR